MQLFQKVKQWARAIKRDAVALWFAGKHPATPMAVKLLCLFVVAYALSPIDLIPDFIPVLGYVDDALLLPGLIWLAVRMLPPELLEACRREGDAWLAHEGRKPVSYWGAVLVVVVWAAVAWLAWRLWIAPAA